MRAMGPQGAGWQHRRPPPPLAAAAGCRLVWPCASACVAQHFGSAYCRTRLCPSWRLSWQRCGRGRSRPRRLPASWRRRSRCGSEQAAVRPGVWCPLVLCNATTPSYALGSALMVVCAFAPVRHRAGANAQQRSGTLPQLCTAWGRALQQLEQQPLSPYPTTGRQGQVCAAAGRL